TDDAVLKLYADKNVAGLPADTAGISNSMALVWNGSQWLPTTVNTGSSAGTVLHVGSGSGLTGGPITSSGTLSVDDTYFNPRYVNVVGDTMSGLLNMGTLKVTALGYPTASDDAS